MAKQGDIQRRFCALACGLLLLQVSLAQGDQQAADTAPSSTTPGPVTLPAAGVTLPAAGEVQGHGPYRRGPEYDEPPHRHHPKPDYDYRGPDSGPDSGPTSFYGPDTCPSCLGKVVAVWCWEDSSGRIQDIAYLNSETENAVATYLGCSGATLPTTTPTRTFLLRPDESIVRIETCDGKHGRLESLSFVTDKHTRLLCGKRKSHRDTYASIEAVSAEPQDTLASEEADADSTTAEGIAPQSTQGKHRKDGGHHKHGHGHKKEEHKSSYGKPGYGKPDYGKSDYDKADYGKSDYDKSGYGKEEHKADHPDYYYPSHPDGGHKCNTIHSKQACWGHRRRTSRTFPLAGFDVTCTANKHVGGIMDLCYNTNYTSCATTAPPSSVRVTASINLGSDPCPTTPQAIAALAAELRGVSQVVSTASGSPPVIGSIVWGQCFECSNARTQGEDIQLVRQLLQASNTTLTSGSVFVVPSPPNTGVNVTSFLSQQQPQDFCLINGTDTCNGLSVDSITYTL